MGSTQLIEIFNPEVCRKKYTREDLEKLSQDKQRRPIEELIKFLTTHGYEPSNNKGSHETYKHSDLNLTRVLIHPHNGSNDLAINKSVAEACLAVRNKLQEIEKENLTDKFETAQAPPPKDKPDLISYDQLPENLTAHRIGDKYIIRHAELPCVGINTSTENLIPHELDGYIKDVTERANKVQKTIDHIINKFEGTQTNKKNGTIILTIAAYNINIALPPFEAEPNTPGPTAKLNDFIKHIESLDSSQQDFVLKTLNELKKGQKKYNTPIYKENSNKDGTKTLNILYRSTITNETKWFSIKCSKGNRPYEGEVSKINDELFNFSCKGTSESTSFARLLEENYGYETNFNKDTNEITVTHPFYGLSDFTILSPDYLPTYESIIKDLEKGKIKNLEEAADLYNKTLKQREKIIKIRTKALKELEEKAAQCTPLTIQCLEHFKNNPEKFTKIVLPGYPSNGKITIMRYRDNATDEVFKIECIATKTPTIDKVLYNEEDIRAVAKKLGIPPSNEPSTQPENTEKTAMSMSAEPM